MESVVNHDFTVTVGQVNCSKLLFALNADIENIAAAQYHVAVISGWGVSSIFGSPLQDDIHVTVGVDHSSSIFNVVLKSDAYLTVQFLHQQIERLSGGFHSVHLSSVSFLPLNKLATASVMEY